MIRHQVPLHNLATALIRQLTEYLAQMPPKLPEDPLLAALLDVHPVILAVPARMAKALVFCSS